LNSSAKAVVHLAIRIGLGQILTAKVFPVLMCDEVDAGCDIERAEAIAGCLNSGIITKSIKQVVIVTHKEIPADHYVRLPRTVPAHINSKAQEQRREHSDA
jgi:hypothetical protein